MAQLAVKFLSILALYFISINTGITQNDCKVLLDQIAGQYTGDCKKGLADGHGMAQGEDKYEGEFKKGLPNGAGVYTWANGDSFHGDFKKGLKEGKGKMIFQLPGGQMKEQLGFWAKDKYIGEHESPYEIRYKSPGVLSVRISEREKTDDENALFLEIQHKGRVQQSPDFAINVTTGSLLSRYQTGTSTKIIISQLPFGFVLSYLGESVELQFYQETAWTVKLDFNK